MSNRLNALMCILNSFYKFFNKYRSLVLIRKTGAKCEKTILCTSTGDMLSIFLFFSDIPYSQDQQLRLIYIFFLNPKSVVRPLETAMNMQHYDQLCMSHNNNNKEKERHCIKSKRLAHEPPHRQSTRKATAK